MHNNLYAVYILQINMKTIMITDEVYSSLFKVKDGKSFSELLAELVALPQKEKKTLMKRIAGILSGKEADAALKKVRAARRNTRARSYGPTS